MGVFLVPQDHEEEVFDKMNPVALKFYDKNLKPLAVPSHGVMHGYINCTAIDMEAGKKGKVKVDTLEDLEEMYNDGSVELAELVYLEGRPTTYGRAKIESFLGTTINRALGSLEELPLIPITGENIEEFMRYIALSKDPAGITRDIRVFVLEISTLEGFSALSLDQLYTQVPKEFLEELDEIQEDDTLDGIQKFIRISTVNDNMKDYVKKNMDQDLKQTMINSNRMKIDSLLEMTLPRATVDDDGRLLSNESSLYQSLNEEEYRAHSLQNRMILNLKQQLVPRSGYLNRQMIFLSQGLEFHKELTDKTNIGILLPHKKAEGRTTLDGKILRKSASDSLVRVKSVAVTDKNYICPEHLNQVTFPPEETPPAFGLRATTSLTEQMTQAGLSLKHSGSFVQVPEENRLTNKRDSPGKVVINNEDKIINIVDDKGKISEQYPLPNRFDVINDTVSKKGSYIGTTLQTASAGLPLDVMIKMMSARKAMPDEGLAKNKITLSNSYSPWDGEIKYDFEKGVYFIGNKLMGKIDPTAVYYWPQGYKIKKYDKVHSHPLDVKWYFKNKIPIDDVYFIFRKEFVYWAGNLTEELVEVLFHLLVNKDFKTGSHEFLGTNKGVTKGNSSFFAQLSFEKGKDAIQRLSSGVLKFENDIFTRNILDHLIISANSKKTNTSK
jgi:hypothetical protein